MNQFRTASCSLFYLLLDFPSFVDYTSLPCCGTVFGERETSSGCGAARGRAAFPNPLATTPHQSISHFVSEHAARQESYQVKPPLSAMCWQRSQARMNRSSKASLPSPQWVQMSPGFGWGLVHFTSSGLRHQKRPFSPNSFSFSISQHPDLVFPA